MITYIVRYIIDHLSEKEIAQETGVLFVDLYHESGINRDNFEDYLFDGLHPNDAGNKVVIDLLTKKFNLD